MEVLAVKRGTIWFPKSELTHFSNLSVFWEPELTSPPNGNYRRAPSESLGPCSQVTLTRADLRMCILPGCPGESRAHQGLEKTVTQPNLPGNFRTVVLQLCFLVESSGELLKSLMSSLHLVPIKLESKRSGPSHHHFLILAGVPMCSEYKNHFSLGVKCARLRVLPGCA